LLAYLIFPARKEDFQPLKANRQQGAIDGDFRLHTCTTELILVPVTPKAEKFLNQPQDATAPYYRAIIVEKEALLRFAEDALAHGLSISLRVSGEQRSRFMLFK
jgi:hypothetical protein